MREDGRIELVTALYGGMPRKEIIARLRALREDFDSFLFLLVLYYVCHSLGLNYEEREEVLTPGIAAGFEEWPEESFEYLNAYL